MSELSEKNYKRINIINWVLSVPILVMFSWPFYHASNLIGADKLFTYPGAFLFALPFMMTILHGHVTMALGAAHRHHYYDWLDEHSLTHGLLFHQVMVSTRFRVTLVIASLVILLIGYLSSMA